MVGNLSNYTKLDILRCFLNIRNGTSRNEIVTSLDLGEGTVRTILDSLKNRNLITSTRNGHSLTYKGLSLLGKINSMVELKDAALDEYKHLKKSAIRLRASSSKKEYELRDIAVKNGAEAALVLRYDGSKLIMPNYNKKDYLYEELQNHFNLVKDDLVVVSMAKDKRWAEISNLAIAVETNYDFKKLFELLN